jgi:4-amino-4-deoxy-L-arabinose transferase-like glycosyltransferase
VQRIIREYLPELFLVFIASFFFLRELGTFPSAWEDDSIFMLVARMLADGHGYTLPVLERMWEYPYILGVGPTLIVPSAVAIKLFGFSVAAARIVQVLYLAGCSVCVYSFSKVISGRKNALWTAALLVTLSAFVNTGKPLLGEVPALFFLMLGLLFWLRTDQSGNAQWGILTGVSFGLAAVTKLTFGIVFPSLVLCIIFALFRKNHRSIMRLMIILVTAMFVFSVWKIIEILHNQSSLSFLLLRSGLGQGAVLLNVLRNNSSLLLRMPYQYFAFLFTFAAVGAWSMHKSVPRDILCFLWACIILFTIYFLNNEGWYRHLLPAHVLLLSFVPVGVYGVFGNRWGRLILLVCVAAQSWWQWDHRGSTRSEEAAQAATVLEERYRDTSLIVRHSEVFVRDPYVPNWLFLPLPEIASYAPTEYVHLSESLQCVPQLWKMPLEEQRALGAFVEQVHQRFALVVPNFCAPLK